MDFSFVLDGASVAQMNYLRGSSARMAVEIESALDDISAQLEAEIPNQMNWQNPSGKLAGSFSTQSTQGQREIGSDLPYSRRRELSFKGPDSLGRMFPNDPAAYYMQNAIQASENSITNRLSIAVDKAFHP